MAQQQNNHVQLIALLSQLSALFHDFGKINPFFSQKLTRSKKKGSLIADPFRHEWVSLRLFEAFVRSHQSEQDDPWITSLAHITPEHLDLAWFQHIHKDGLDTQAPITPLQGLPATAQLVAWLIVSHHRLPSLKNCKSYNVEKFATVLEDIDFQWCSPKNRWKSEAERQEEIQQCWNIDPQDIPFNSRTWCQEINQVATQLQDLLQMHRPSLDDPYLSHVARMVLMLSDHYYSRLDANKSLNDPRYKPYANTDQKGKLKQHLDEHLIGVSQSAQQILSAAYPFEHAFPRLIRKNDFEEKTTNEYFKWQDRAFAEARFIQQHYSDYGFFGVNLASTGRGKTLANFKIMSGLSDPQLGARFNIALGLRTLTLQTGRALRHKLKLDDTELAVMVGGGAVKDLFEKFTGVSSEEKVAHGHEISGKNHILAENTGSESATDLLDEGMYVDFKISIDDENLLLSWLEDNAHAQKMLDAPILCCTVDHLIPATEGTRGGRQIAPMLRLMSSDLIFDEPDDFSSDDHYALSRLVYWAGLLGSRILLSSATMTPAEINGLYLAYSAGRKAFNRHQSDPNQAIVAAWFDENEQEIQHHLIECSPDLAVDCSNQQFAEKHKQFTQTRVDYLNQQAEDNHRRTMAWMDLPENLGANQKWETVISQSIFQNAFKAHQDNAITDPVTAKKYSVGLVRFANIDPLAAIAQRLFQQEIDTNTRLHLCVYHSRFPLLVRHNIEYLLDGILDRNQEKQPHDHDLVRTWLTEYPEENHMIMVLASPVCEVGRDHDYDWMILEPSSMRSIIQASGRVRRHRLEAYHAVNIYLMEGNIQHYKYGDSRCVFSRPGFENNLFKMRQHYLKWSNEEADDGLISRAHFQQIDAIARLRPNHPTLVRKNYHNGYAKLADLEHDHLMHLMLNRGVSQKLDRECSEDGTRVELPVYKFWQTPIHYTGILQNITRFRKSQIEFLVAFTSKDENQPLALHQYSESDGYWMMCDGLLNRIELEKHAKINLWPNVAAEKLLKKYIDTIKEQGDWSENCQKYLSLNLPKLAHGRRWLYHDWLGFIRS